MKMSRIGYIPRQEQGHVFESVGSSTLSQPVAVSSVAHASPPGRTQAHL